MSASAFRATYSDWRLVKSRGVVQVVMEVPLADADKAYEILGGMPNPASEQWFGIAAIRADKSGQVSPSTARTTRAWKDMLPQQQAGIRCDEVTFAVFLHEEYPEEWHEAMEDPAETVRLICGVQSRSELSTNASAAMTWRKLDDRYEAWRTMERVA